MSDTNDPPPPRLQFSIRFLLGLTALVAVTCAFATSVGWWTLATVALSYLCLTGYFLVFVFWRRTLRTFSPPRAKLPKGLLTTKFIVGWLVLMWLLFLLLVGLLSQAG